MVSVCLPKLGSLTEVLNEYGSIHEIPEEEACKLFWDFWDSGELVDDLFFFVSDLFPGQQRALLQVCRHSPQQRPEINIKVDWNATLVVNYICHSNFALRVSVCSYAEHKNSSVMSLVVDEEATVRVFASPIEDCQMKIKKSGSFEDCAISFPQIYFSVNNFDSCFEHIRLNPENVLIVELLTAKQMSIPKSRKGSFYTKFTSSESQSIIFQGAISYDSVLQVAADNHFDGLVLMKGPDDVGEAQIQVHNKKAPSTATKIKQLFRSVISKSELTRQASDFECRLTFIRMHWLDILSKIY